MAQLTIYLTEDVAQQVRARAQRAGKSLSAYVADVLERDAGGNVWPTDFVDLLGHGHGDLVEPEDPPSHRS